MKALFFAIFLSLWVISAHSNSHHPQDFLKTIQGTKNEALQIYNHFCANCHAKKPLIPLGAPRIGEEADWQPRLKQGLKVLLAHVNEGWNAMPPRGGCFECSDEQLMLSVLFLLPDNLKKDIFKK